MKDRADFWAAQYELDADIVRAVVTVESSWDTWAARYEPKWRWYLSINYWARQARITSHTERVCQKMSWGLMQVMGTVARELGHKDDITRLCDPEVGLQLGCKKLRECLDRFGNYRDALAAYNAGTPKRSVGQRYADRVFKTRDQAKEVAE